MAATTCLDLIKRSLRLLGVLSQGETPVANESDEALKALNSMVESWNNEKLMLYMLTNTMYTITSGTASYTYGPAGSGATWESTGVTRPLILDKCSAFIRQSGTDSNLEYYSNSRFNEICGKSDAGYPSKWACDFNYPIATIRIFPVPNETDLTFGLTEQSALTKFNTISDTLVLPNGYEQALTYGLALELSPEYGVEPSALVLNTAQNSKFLIKRVNSVDVLLDCDNALIRQGSYDINSDSYVR